MFSASLLPRCLHGPRHTHIRLFCMNEAVPGESGIMQGLNRLVTVWHLRERQVTLENGKKGGEITSISSCVQDLLSLNVKLTIITVICQ